MVLSRFSSCAFFLRKLHPFTADQNVHRQQVTAQHRAITSSRTALGIIKSLVAPDHGPLLCAPFTFCCIFARALAFYMDIT